MHSFGPAALGRGTPDTHPLTVASGCASAFLPTVGPFWNVPEVVPGSSQTSLCIPSCRQSPGPACSSAWPLPYPAHPACASVQCALGGGSVCVCGCVGASASCLSGSQTRHRRVGLVSWVENAGREETSGYATRLLHGSLRIPPPPPPSLAVGPWPGPDHPCSPLLPAHPPRFHSGAFRFPP